jgi:hypothetical protein
MQIQHEPQAHLQAIWDGMEALLQPANLLPLDGARRGDRVREAYSWLTAHALLVRSLAVRAHRVAEVAASASWPAQARARAAELAETCAAMGADLEALLTAYLPSAAVPSRPGLPGPLTNAERLLRLSRFPEHQEFLRQWCRLMQLMVVLLRASPPRL